MNSFDADQEADWPLNCSQSLLGQALDEAAHCSICRDFYNTPLSLLCGHSFCAECIRANIQFQERNTGKAVCPQCREPADSRQIIANHALRDLVNNFLLARPQLVASTGIAAHGPQGQQSSKRQERYVTRNGGKKKRKVSNPHSGDTIVVDLDTGSEPEASGRNLRKRKSEPIYFPDPPTDAEAEAESSISEPTSSSEPNPASAKPVAKKSRKSESPNARQKGPGKIAAAGKLPKNWAECPCCQQNFPMAIFNDHLDGCLQNGTKSDSQVKPEGPAINIRAGKKGKGTRPKLVVPPKLLLAIEKDKALKERLKRYYLPIKGSRQELEQRYTRFRVEVQTALDRCESGATYASLAKRVISRETSETNASGPAASARPAIAKKPLVDLGQGNDFDDLIKATKLRAGKKENPAAKPVTLEQDSEGASGSQDDGKVREGQKPGYEAGRNGSWGRGFRRSNTGGTQHQDPTRTASSEQQLDGEHVTINGHCETAPKNSNEPPSETRLKGCRTVSSVSQREKDPRREAELPWMQEQKDLNAKEVIEDTEDEEEDAVEE